MLTITVKAPTGRSTRVGTATASIVSGPGSFVGRRTPATTRGGGDGDLHGQITSLVAGTTLVSGDLGHPGERPNDHAHDETAVNTAAGGSGNASKTWQKGDSQITTLSNPTGGPQTRECR